MAYYDKLKINDPYARVTFLEDYLTDYFTIREKFLAADVHVEVEFDIDSVDEDNLKDMMERKGYTVFSDDDPQLTVIDEGLSAFSDEEILEEIDNRDLDMSFDIVSNAAWYYKTGRFQDFLEELEKQHPIELAGISRMKLSK